ncbi:MAG: hypothetical protein WA991_10915 [Ornithinimicrobium sp.]
METSADATPNASRPDTKSRSSMPAVVGIALGLTALVMVILTAFAYPATHAEANNIPIAVVGPEPAVLELSTRLARQGDGDAFEVQTLTDRDAARSAVDRREIYGAIVVGPQGGEMLVASAASPAVAQLLAGVAAGIPVEAGGPLQVTDVVELPQADPRGTAIAASLLPLIVAGVGSAALIFLRVEGTRLQLVAAAATAISVGFGVSLILSTWLDALPGSFLLLWGSFALAIGSISVLSLGLCRLMGVAGIGVGALLVMFLGNPFSGATSAPELLPAGWGLMGQLLPPGASASLLRSTSYFEGGGAGFPVLVLCSWLALGGVLMVAGSRRSVTSDVV